MEFVSRALEWVRTVLLGPRTPGWHRRTPAPRTVLPVPYLHPSPEVCGALLMAARSHRRERQGQPPWDETGALVRPYVACLGEGVYADALASPWGEAR